MIGTFSWRHVGSLMAIVLSSSFLAGIYGILHDQLTYTISPEYYTKFKFIQFGIIDAWGDTAIQNPRIAVSVVGLMATWWTGLIIGPVLGLVGFFFFDAKSLYPSVLRACGITLITAICCGLFGLAIGSFVFTERIDVDVPIDVVERANFITVGIMHNFSYLGGALGLILGIRYLIRQKDQEQL